MKDNYWIFILFIFCIALISGCAVEKIPETNQEIEIHPTEEIKKVQNRDDIVKIDNNKESQIAILENNIDI